MRKIIFSIFIAVLGALAFIAPTFAEAKCPSDCVPTSVLGDYYDEKGNKIEKPDQYTGEKIRCKCDDGNGSGIIDILSLIINIMTIGVGILGVIGITIVGIQYLTAGGNEEKTRKAKRRMFEIVIGLVAYVIIYALLNWLIPNFKPIGA